MPALYSKSHACTSIQHMHFKCQTNVNKNSWTKYSLFIATNCKKRICWTKMCYTDWTFAAAIFRVFHWIFIFWLDHCEWEELVYEIRVFGRQPANARVKQALVREEAIKTNLMFKIGNFLKPQKLCHGIFYELLHIVQLDFYSGIHSQKNINSYFKTKQKLPNWMRERLMQMQFCRSNFQTISFMEK